MEVKKSGSRYDGFHKWESLNKEYDYRKNGLLKHMLSRTIVSSTNPFLQWILSIIETSIIIVLDGVDDMKNFKNFMNKNR